MRMKPRILVGAIAALTVLPDIALACMGPGIDTPPPPMPTHEIVLWVLLATLTIALFTYRRLEAFYLHVANTSPTIQKLLTEGRARLATGATYGGLAIAISLFLVAAPVQMSWEQPGCSGFGLPKISVGQSR